MKQEVQLKLEKIKLLEKRLALQEGLPHLYGFKKYEWQENYCNAKRTPKRFICAANQIGKSTIQICDRIHVATSPDLWPLLWPKQFEFNKNAKPYSWYLYPNQDTVMSEFMDKWVPYFLPRGEYKDHPVYGWKETITNKVLKCITFNSGWRIYFKTYNQNVHDLQSGTVFAIDCDEELPENLLSELEARMFASDGYFSMAFTATMGQEIWKRAIEGQGEEELFPDAFKVQVSMYDCLKYADGSKTPWSEERIKRIEQNCKSKNEVDKRVYGRFVLDEGLRYPGFERDRNYKPMPKKLNFLKSWSIYGGVDIGSGGKSGHPASYVFIAVSPSFDKIRVFKGKRLDGIETTASDILQFYKKDRGTMNCASQVYDYAAKDFGTIANRTGEPFRKAKKDHALGEMALNTAFKTGILVIYEDQELFKLVRELETLLMSTPKRQAKDDFIDSLRYALMEVPVDWEAVLDGKKPAAKKKMSEEQKARPNWWSSEEEERRNKDECDEEFDFWSELY